MTLEIKGYTIIKTCEAFPEQYDVLKDGEKVGYLRLRYGNFTVEESPEVFSRLFYSTNTKGYGEFIDEEERSFYLNKAIDVIIEETKKDQYSEKETTNEPSNIITGVSDSMSIDDSVFLRSLSKIHLQIS